MTRSHATAGLYRWLKKRVDEELHTRNLRERQSNAAAAGPPLALEKQLFPPAGFPMLQGMQIEPKPPRLQDKAFL